MPKPAKANVKPVPTPPEAKPKPTEKLSPEQQAHIGAWLRSHWTNQDCPFHPNVQTRWQVGDSLISTVSYLQPGGGTGVGGPSYPMVVVVCTVCGYSVLVNAIVSGLIDRGPRSSPTEPEAAEADDLPDAPTGGDS